jgi:hypothetical protein
MLHAPPFYGRCAFYVKANLLGHLCVIFMPRNELGEILVIRNSQLELEYNNRYVLSKYIFARVD